ncbi:MAG: hypothetical protein A2Z88_05455 [Omnitrophica WOR_2 bacterium GWA2_47_8]|nr:MAG: hypothetical protein A2Z88_05455 [Omnitrophica WOR_2 bacterium GWA2_47_8]
MTAVINFHFYIFAFVLFFLSSCAESNVSAPAPVVQEQEEYQYAIKKFGVSAGAASLAFREEDLNGQKVPCVVFTAKSLNFFDEEKIYMDPKTFYPTAVKRDLNIFGKREKIDEYYDHQKGEIKIVKDVKGQKEVRTLQKQGPIDNLYCFLYRFRQQPLPKPGTAMTIRLPTKDVRIVFEGEENFKVGREKVKSYVLESDPSQYKIWLDKGAKRVPLRIDGAMGAISSSLVIKETPR